MWCWWFGKCSLGWEWVRMKWVDSCFIRDVGYDSIFFRDGGRWKL